MGAPFTLSQEQKNQLQEIGEKFNLRFIVVHGSYAKGVPHQGSDLDVAVLGYQFIPIDVLLELHGLIAGVFGDNRERELDLKSLHGADPLFRHLVVRDGVLLYGDETDFNEFKTYAMRSFDDARKLFRLEEALIKKQNADLLHVS